MNNKFIIGIIFFGIVTFAVTTNGSAKTFAYLIGEGEVASLDTETNITTQLQFKLQTKAEFGGVLAADRMNKRLYIRHCTRLGTCKVGVYGLIDLKFIKELPLETQDHNIEQLIYPDGTKFLIQYLSKEDENDEGGFTTDVFDAVKLTEIGNLSAYVNLENAAFSADKKNIYSIVNGYAAKLYVVDSETFETKSSKDLSQYWRKKPEVFASGILHSSDNNKILIGENLKIKKGYPDKLDLFVYDIETQQLSKRISTGLQGYASITPDGNKIILDENQDIRDRGSIVGSKSLGKLHVYNITNGSKMAVISFTVSGGGNILDIKPTSDIVYYVSDGDVPNTSTITIIDIINNKLIKTIQMPFKVIDMILFDK